MADIWLNVDSAVVVPLNLLPFVDDTDFKSIETVVSASSLWICWNFIPVTGSPTQVAFVPATIYDRGNGIFTYNIPASSGTINNDAEGSGWFTGSGIGLLPFRSPIFGFRASVLNSNLIVNANPLATGSGLATIPTTDYTALVSTRMSGSYLNSLASASRVEAIQTDLDNPDQYKATVTGLASASRVEAIQTTVDSIPTTDYTNLISTRMSGSYLGSLASASTVSVMFDTNIDESISFIEGMRIIMAVLFGNSSGGGTGEITFDNASSNNFNRVVATVDENGNRTVTFLDGGDGIM
jgi:hypothetical protein